METGNMILKNLEHAITLLRQDREKLSALILEKLLRDAFDAHGIVQILEHNEQTEAAFVLRQAICEIVSLYDAITIEKRLKKVS